MPRKMWSPPGVTDATPIPQYAVVAEGAAVAGPWVRAAPSNARPSTPDAPRTARRLLVMLWFLSSVDLHTA
ncbi:hypothetical protein GCM10009789_59220 [Kribbella sancticallisti]|uniref:Uncharacterized protein n=1 Tax=Kribbella sancticallisti TaxID=460087 RepID=A0ABP4Q444_9ACTN